MKLKNSVVSLSENAKEVARNLIEKYPELIDKDLEDVENDPKVIEAAEKIESIKKFKIKDYESVINFFINEKLKLYEIKERKGGIVDKTEKTIFDIGKILIEKTKERRRERNRQTSHFDTNILSHAPFFVGGSRKRKEKAAKEGHILIDKSGLRKMTYQNDLGMLLTCNDAKTLAALFALWGEQGMGETVKFTEYQLLDKLNAGIGGKQYQIIRDSLEKLRNTSVVLQEAYQLSEGKRTITERFQLIIADTFIVDEDEHGRVRSKEYSVAFSPYIHKSFQDGYCTLISLAVFDELETDAAKAIYLMISGMKDMDSNDAFIKLDGTLEIPITPVYETLFLENTKSKNKIVVEKACEELKDIDVISDFYFSGKGRTVNSLVIEPSEWLRDVLSNGAKLGTAMEQKEKLYLS
ncbi:replication initiator protein A [Bacillus cereus group sp. TH152-1LC]|uniref:replication initiator protein A n=1 Tax=Bacillus cereus group sp. TH152-1LC TaxID=3018060 RepID=UPI0022E22DC7|nr:replication initiator protein A [Bacillus cereus group sp. TH152-1LC]MDA1674686.1 replication initiator protein A [Bacillus cereus group sp. TH152-1LC]